MSYMMNNEDKKNLALNLLRADTASDVITLLRHANLWDDHNKWRLYGDKEGNRASVGNQQAAPENALAEKVINSVDALLLRECRVRGIDPESKDNAPHSVRQAVAKFFKGENPIDHETARNLTHWSSSERTKQSREITIAATGAKPGSKRNMCLTITDKGEGQSPNKIPETILSLNSKNKQGIAFVQGKFNMGGSGALIFCEESLQLVISRRHPELVDSEDQDGDLWGVTVVRREAPRQRDGDSIHSEYTYLAPVGYEERPREGKVMRFKADSLPIMPIENRAYDAPLHWGTAIKLYEYKTKSAGQSNILMRDGLLYAMERLLPEIALPVRMHECRDFAGRTGSFDTTLSGLVTRLEDGRGDNLEPGFPISAILNIKGCYINARIYLFKDGAGKTYLDKEGVIFAINGQSHGHFHKSIFGRPKRVGLGRLKDSLVVLLDCSSLDVRQREDLFMSSRDRLTDMPIRKDIENEVQKILKTNESLKRIQNERRQRDLDNKLSEDKPLADVLNKIITGSPVLQNFFGSGRKLANPFPKKPDDKQGNKINPRTPFVGKEYPSYFHFHKKKAGDYLHRNTERGRTCKIAFDTDAENKYFDRSINPGKVSVAIMSHVDIDISYNITLDAGKSILSLDLPQSVKVGDKLLIKVSVEDGGQANTFENKAALTVIEKSDRKSGSNKKTLRDAMGMDLPKIVPVKEGDDNWVRHEFVKEDACHIISEADDSSGEENSIINTFYININNVHLGHELKSAPQSAKILEAKYKYGNVLLGLALMKHYHEQKNDDDYMPEIRVILRALSPVLLPIINSLSGIDEQMLEYESDED